MKIINKKFSYLIIMMFLMSLLAFQISFAAEGANLVKTGLEQSAKAGELDTEQTDLPTIAGSAINYLFGILGVIFLTIVLVGGYLWMTAGGNEEKVGKAKGFIINGINGMIVIFLAYALVYVIMASLGGAISGRPVS